MGYHLLGDHDQAWSVYALSPHPCFADCAHLAWILGLAQPLCRLGTNSCSVEELAPQEPCTIT